MRVYVLEGVVQYEGGSVLGAYSTRELAEAAARAHRESVEMPYDFYDVHEVVVDAAAELHLV